MNVYFLVEGRSTEKKLYPSWLSTLVPELERVKFYDGACKNNYYILSANGYPRILGEGLNLALQHLSETQSYDRLVICLDSDEQSIHEREEIAMSRLLEKIETKQELRQVKFDIIVQHRCIETWLLGNRKIFNSRQPVTKPLSDYKSYYNVCDFDPELMGKFNFKNHADFHFEYLKEIFNEKGLRYTKKYPQDTQKSHYLEQLINRVQDGEGHLNTFARFLSLCEAIKLEL
ncbi:MAG: hypothetical protein EAZ61_06845 [Oscillatoriales cyanobacterium]|nr:MAG: hypothetical protein EAZ61_06845 [Oscillatoriales cyanobacterium]